MAIFVDPTVSGTGTGTYGDPYKSWDSVVWSADNLFLGKQGTTFTGIINPTSGGTAAQRKTIGTYYAGSGEMMRGLHADMHKIDGSGQTRAIYIGTTRTHVDIVSLWADGCLENGIEKATGGSDVTVTSDIRVITCRVTNMTVLGASGIKIVGNNSVVEGCDLDNIARDGILVYSQNTRIVGNRTRRTAQDATDDTGDAIQIVGAATNYYVGYNDCEQLRPKKQCLNVNDPAASGRIVHNLFVIDPSENPGTHKCINIVSTAPTYVGFNDLTGGEYVLFCEAAGALVEGNIMRLQGPAAQAALTMKGIGSTARLNTLIGDGRAIGASHSSSFYTGVTFADNKISGFQYGLRLFADAVDRNNQIFDCSDAVVDSNYDPVTLGVGTTIVEGEQDGSHYGYMLNRAGRMLHNPPPVGG